MESILFYCATEDIAYETMIAVISHLSKLGFSANDPTNINKPGGFSNSDTLSVVYLTELKDDVMKCPGSGCEFVAIKSAVEDHILTH